jgi:two-component system nitrogen regulation response regulator GlnG
VVQAVGDVITPDCLPRSVRGGGDGDGFVAPGLDVAALVAELLRTGQDDVYRTVTEAVDRVVLEAVLRHTGGSQVTASALLGISRTTLRAKLQTLGLVIEKHLRPDAAAGSNG